MYNSSVTSERHCGCFQMLKVLNEVAMNIYVRVGGVDMFFVCLFLSRSEIVGPHCENMFNFVKKVHDYLLKWSCFLHWH